MAKTISIRMVSTFEYNYFQTIFLILFNQKYSIVKNGKNYYSEIALIKIRNHVNQNGTRKTLQHVRHTGKSSQSLKQHTYGRTNKSVKWLIRGAVLSFHLLLYLNHLHQSEVLPQYFPSLSLVEVTEMYSAPFCTFKFSWKAQSSDY